MRGRLCAGLTILLTDHQGGGFCQDWFDIEITSYVIGQIRPSDRRPAWVVDSWRPIGSHERLRQASQGNSSADRTDRNPSSGHIVLDDKIVDIEVAVVTSTESVSLPETCAISSLSETMFRMGIGDHGGFKALGGPCVQSSKSLSCCA